MNKSSFFIVGQHAVIEALRNPKRKVLRVFLTEESKKNIHRKSPKKNLLNDVKVYFKTKKELDKYSTKENLLHQGYVAEIEHFESKMDQKVWYFALAGVNNKTEGAAYRAGGIAESALQHRLRFNHIPYEALPHFGRFNGGPKIRTADIHFVRSHAPFAIHMWGDAGQQRIGKAAQMGSLFIDDVSTAGGCNHTSNYT